ncbi:hypothetical protein CLF_101729 [Clonorchis sinensis]|uniref:Uncharacterized protein n=1 Tax=Clonorchis sinensis TaxID=79923 RepID=G7Y6F5_CLOSI|nr:hypothetical protein CLF_101729 [Clonorchis sinensis]
MVLYTNPDADVDQREQDRSAAKPSNTAGTRKFCPTVWSHTVQVHMFVAAVHRFRPILTHHLFGASLASKTVKSVWIVVFQTVTSLPDPLTILYRSYNQSNVCDLDIHLSADNRQDVLRHEYRLFISSSVISEGSSNRAFLPTSGPEIGERCVYGTKPIYVYQIIGIRLEVRGFSPYEMTITSLKDVETKCCYKAHEFHSCTVKDYVIHRAANALGCVLEVLIDHGQFSVTGTQELQNALSTHRQLTFGVIAGRHQFTPQTDIQFGIPGELAYNWLHRFIQYGLNIHPAGRKDSEGHIPTEWFAAQIYRTSIDDSQGPYWYKVVRFLWDMTNLFSTRQIYLYSAILPRVKAVKYRGILEIPEGIQTALYHGTTHGLIHRYCCPSQQSVSFNYLHCDVLQYYVATEMEILGCAIELHVLTNALGGVPKPSQLQMGTDVFAFPNARKKDAESSEENGFEINFSLSSNPSPNSEDLLAIWPRITFDYFPDATLIQTLPDWPVYTLRINDLRLNSNTQDYWIQALILLHRIALFSNTVIENTLITKLRQGSARNSQQGLVRSCSGTQCNAILLPLVANAGEVETNQHHV